ncbi:GNAT family N-acetyltransferase [Chitinophaga sp. Cy-1792]|uniref:GNAT family N-acetyltransferase n=1 Tax=Chitinophaga sp. Cy-1792 TaxID=2608339 RepID=UPI001420C4F3|nr:GNAT family N-acetyltransferase [Chitinophaga sp. Cy-1792]NIG52933.1 GNAT family N-acetyltransferase [Chitinophaga sp. Cy-1792]
MRWETKKFEELSTTELYAILHLRSEIFVVEQNCPYQDLDYSDQKALHLMGYDEEGRLAAYTRLFDKGIKFKEASIGRVVTAAFARGKGAGRSLMEESIHQVYKHFGTQPIRIGAQQYLEKFYGSLGFTTVSDMYLEDNIPHVEMLK